MNKELTHKTYQALEGFDSTLFQTNASFLLNIHKAISKKGIAFLFENKQSITILLMLIISSIKQRLTITDDVAIDKRDSNMKKQNIIL